MLFDLKKVWGKKSQFKNRPQGFQEMRAFHAQVLSDPLRCHGYRTNVKDKNYELGQHTAMLCRPPKTSSTCDGYSNPADHLPELHILHLPFPRIASGDIKSSWEAASNEAHPFPTAASGTCKVQPNKKKIPLNQETRLVRSADGPMSCPRSFAYERSALWMMAHLWDPKGGAHTTVEFVSVFSDPFLL